MHAATRRAWPSLLVLSLLLQGTRAMAQPTPVPLDTSITGTISTPGEEDWYSVNFTTVGDLTVTQTSWPPYIDTRIAVYGPDSQVLGQFNPVAAARPGTYYIRVWSAANGSSAELYAFTVSLAVASTGNDVDSGGNAAAAAVPIALDDDVSDTIAPSKETSDGAQDEDWYQVTTSVIGDLAVTQTAWPPYIDTRIAIFGPDDPTLAQPNPVFAASPGTYHFRVWSANDGSSIAPYTFHVTLAAAATGNDIDLGANAPAGAVATTVGAEVSDTIAPSKETAGSQDVDWYTLTTTTLGDLSVTQTAWPSYIDTRIAIFGPDSSTQAQPNPVPAAAPGTYYLRVWSANDGSSIAPYTFHTGQVEASTGNDIDQGANAPGGAVPIAVNTAVTDTIGPSAETAGVQDVDWFSFTTPVPGTLSLQVTAWPPYIETRYELYGPGDPGLAHSNPSAPGTYYVKVYSANNGSSIVPYVFNVLYEPAAGHDAGWFDAATAVDAATPADAASAGDAASGADSSAPVDAAVVDVAAVDSAVTADSAVADSSAATDLAHAGDAVVTVDGAHPQLDAAPPADAGADAAPTRDATGGDEGDDPATCGGCAASTSTLPGAPLVLVLALALAGLRRRRRV